MTPAELRALSERVRTEEPSRELADEVLLARGWKNHSRSGWYTPAGEKIYNTARPDLLTSYDAAIAGVPRRWLLDTLSQFTEDAFVWDWRVLLEKCGKPFVSCRAIAPTGPRAITAAALLAMAKEAE